MVKADAEINLMVQDRVLEELPPGPIDMKAIKDDVRVMIEDSSQ